MKEEDLQTQVPEEAQTPVAAEGNGSPPDDVEVNNLLEQIRARRREITEQRQTYISIPGYDDLGLVAQYHLLDAKQGSMIVDKVNRSTRDRLTRGLLIAADTLIAACDGLYLEADGEFRPLDPFHTGEPLTYSLELARFLELDGVETARQTVFALFGDNDAALASHTYRLNLWMQNTNRDVDEESLGEL